MRKSDPLPRDQRNTPAKVQDTRPLLERLLDTPHLAQVIPQLQPEVLHKVIQACGLEDCGELLALATPTQLAGVFDLDLWRSDQPGLEEQFDAERFGVWLEVLVDAGAVVAARTLAKMDAELVVTAFAQHVRVSDRASVSFTSVDGEEIEAIRPADDETSCEIGGYRVVAKRTESWDAVVAALISLDAERPASFHRVMRGCRSLSNSGYEIDGLDDLLEDGDQAMFDLAFERERRREKQGYATPAQARAFLQMARQFRPERNATPSGNPVARAYFRALDDATPEPEINGEPRLLPAASDEAVAPADASDAVAALVEVLVEAGVLPQPPRALLDAAKGPSRLARLQTHMQVAYERDVAAYSTRSQELAYLANAIAAGCSIQARAFTSQEASDVAAAVCNLGLENWSSTALPDNFLVVHDLVSVFQAGWTVLYEGVCMYAAEQLIDVLTDLTCGDGEIQRGLDALRINMRKQWKAGTPWLACEALDVVTTLDMPAWAALLGLIGECPVIHAGLAASPGSRIRAVSPSAFEFISENSQIASVHAFMRSLPGTLGR